MNQDKKFVPELKDTILVAKQVVPNLQIIMDAEDDEWTPPLKKAMCMVRDSVFAVVGYFAVRRSDELEGLKFEDIGDMATDIHFTIAQSKTDQYGFGANCVIPDVPELGNENPAHLFRLYLEARKAMGTKKVTPGCYLFPAFPTATRPESDASPHLPRMTKDMAASGLKKVYKEALGASALEGKTTVSVRSGGAKFYSLNGADETAVHQGGWKSAKMLKIVY